MLDFVELYSKVKELEQKVLIENTTSNDLVDAYNQGVDAMANQLMSFINSTALEKAFGGESRG